MDAVVCQLLQSFATENEENFFLDLQIIEIFPGEHYPEPVLLAARSENLAPVTGNF